MDLKAIRKTFNQYLFTLPDYDPIFGCRGVFRGRGYLGIKEASNGDLIFEQSYEDTAHSSVIMSATERSGLSIDEMLINLSLDKLGQHGIVTMCAFNHGVLVNYAYYIDTRVAFSGVDTKKGEGNESVRQVTSLPVSSNNVNLMAAISQCGRHITACRLDLETDALRYVTIA